VKSVEIISKRP